MSQALCPYCGASEGRCVVVGGGRFLTECRSCGRVVEERLGEVDELFIERAHDAPLCIVTPDFSENEAFRAPPIEDDPFESIGFITAFSTWSLEQCPLFTATSTSFSGQLAEMERVLSDSLYSAGTTATSLAGASMSTVDTLRAYFQIVEVSSVLGLERDSCDHAIQLFRDCLSTTYLRNRNIEALATAALVQAIREQNEPRTLQEISAAANIPQKEIARHIKVLSDALKLSQPINSNSISVHMPRFCNLLQLSKTTQDLATHIGEVVINKSFCTRRNPISISAAAIYLSCQLEDKRKTQTEICKATGLTEVTLRKVYKELLENLDDLLPPNYKPAVPLEKAFPVIGTALGRVHVARAAAGVAMSEPSIPGTPYNSAVSNNSTGLGGDISSVVGGSGGSSPGQPNMVRVPVSGVSATDRATAGAPFRGSTPPSSDGRPGIPLFNGPHLGSGAMGGGGEAVENRTRHDSSKEMERDRSQREREKERERDNGMDIDYPPPKKLNMMPPASVPQGFRPSFFPFAQVDPRMFQDMNAGMWPVHLYGTPAMRPEEGTTSARGSDRSREDGGGNPGLPNSKQPPQQYVSFVPGVPDGLSPTNMQVKMLQLMQQRRPPEAVERQGGAFERENREPERDRDHEGETGDNGSHPLPVPSTNPAATLQAFATAAAAAAASGRQGPPVFAGIPPGLWPFLTAGGPVPYGMYPPQLVQGGLPQGIRQGGENHNAGVSEKSLEGLPQGLLNSAGAETLARMAGSGGIPGQAGGLGGQPNHIPMPWPGAPFHPLFLPTTMNVGPGPSGGMSNGMINEGSNGMKREGGGGGDANGRMTASGVAMNLSQRPGTDMFLTMAGNHGPQGPPGHPPGTSQQRPDNDEATTISVAMTNQQPSFERQQMQHGQR